MVATVAVLSDIHGVLPALEAVLAEPECRRPTGSWSPATSPPARCRSRPSTRWPASTPAVSWCAATPTANSSRWPTGCASAASESRPWAGGQLRPDQVPRPAPSAPLSRGARRVRPGVLPWLPTGRRGGRARRHPPGPLGRGPCRRSGDGPRRLLRPHSHAVRAARRPSAGAQPGQRRHAVRRPGAHWALLGTPSPSRGTVRSTSTPSVPRS